MELLAGTGALLRVGLYLLVFWPTVGFYIYRDVRRRDGSRPLVRAAGFGFFGIAGLLTYEMRKAIGESNESD